MKKIIFILLLPITTFSQEFPIVDTIFLDKNWMETDNRAEAEYYRGTQFNPIDSTFLVHDYYLENFKIQMIGYYKRSVKNGNQIGQFNYYHSNGNLRAEFNYENGKFQGLSTRYFTNGNIQSIENYNRGNLVDTLKYYYNTGILREIKFVNPKYNSEIFAEAEKQFQLIAFWDEDQNQQIKNGSGTKSEYFKNGKKRLTIEFQNGFPHGEWIQYKENGGMLSKMIFKNGTFISGIMYPKRKKDIFASLYREPRFPNGIKALDEFISKNIGKCKEAMKEELLVMINISELGIASFDQIVSGEYSHCQYDELSELVRKMPHWIPAVRYGNYVEATYVIRINY